MKDKLGTYYPILALTVVVFASVALLSGMDALTRDMIQYQEDLKIQQSLSELFPDMARYEFDEANEIWTIYADETKLGYAFRAIGKGYGGDIKILVALENRTTIKGIAIIKPHAETPGLGDKIEKPNFTDRFAGLDIADVALTKDGGKIDAITGATISSTAVIDAVGTTAMEKAEFIPD